MAISVKHIKTNGIADWTQADVDAQIALGNLPAGTTLADVVLSSDWNDDHYVEGVVESVTGSAVDNTDPANPVVNSPDLSGLVPYTGATGDVTLGSLSISARTAGTSFTISSTNILDTSTISWLIIEPA